MGIHLTPVTVLGLLSAHRFQDGGKESVMTKVAAVLKAVQKAKADGRCYLAVNKDGSWVITKVGR